MTRRKPLVLAILDGYGLLPAGSTNAICVTTSPRIAGFMQSYPTAILKAAGEAVGLPAGQIGNSEVGHLVIGAGRIVMTGLSLINHEVLTNQIFLNLSFSESIN
ncbi:unnamed protein product [Didymodactylos carnosus]|uniref:Metalloenzyme domain-containing protein n=1 Tax=Didymodactylos carnosus TaxID=1234261 RepID=A0A8S2D2Z2_9BILA|nr:unnamed protein product [Didymodactylos carnosus]CAF3609550.1 unnamed protein product [Didymodactylos carnosus]